jgi:hypothetical protein
MYLEEVLVRKGQTVAELAEAYGHKRTDVAAIWNDASNSDLAKKGDPARLAVGDVLRIPIPWKVTKSVLTVEARGVGMEVARDGARGRRLSWVQTVYRDNQPVGPNPNAFCVDACTPDDDLPFYFTDAEVKAHPAFRAHFADHPARNPPTAAMGTTRWRAVVSIAVVTGRRVTVFDSTAWGFNLDVVGNVRAVGPRSANGTEVNGHLSLLGRGIGTSGVTFAKQGWTFRSPPP